MISLRSLTVVAAVFGVGVPPAQAYEVQKATGTGVELRWTALPMAFNLDGNKAPGTTASATQQAVRSAYKVWQDVSCAYYTYKDLGQVSSEGDTEDGVNTNVWLTYWPTSYGSDTLGRTRIFYDPSSGKILDADTHYNPLKAWSTTGNANSIDVQSVATHEIGHQLGLDHSAYSTATMFWSTGQGDTSTRSLHSDDIAGVCHIYPTGTAPPPECTTDAHCASGETCTNGKCVGVGKKGYGAPCNYQDDCLSDLCLQSGSDTFCSQSCGSQGCPNGDKCVQITGGSISSACLPNSAQRATKDLGDTCTNDLDCKSDICLSVPGSGYLCSQACVVSSNNCPTGYLCANSNVGGLCIPDPNWKAPQADGSACASHQECQSGICQTNKCSAACDPATASCAAGFECTSVAGTGLSTCTPAGSSPAPGSLGAACSVAGDCDSRLCLTEQAPAYCSVYCQPDTGCATGYDCVPWGQGPHICVTGQPDPNTPDPNTPDPNNPEPNNPDPNGEGNGTPASSGCSVGQVGNMPKVLLIWGIICIGLVTRRRR
jgi:Cys-rich repeat protein